MATKQSNQNLNGMSTGILAANYPSIEGGFGVNQFADFVMNLQS